MQAPTAINRIHEFAEHLITQQHLLIREAGLIHKDCVVAWVNPTNVQVTLIHNRISPFVLYSTIQEISQLSHENSCDAQTARWVREFSRFMAADQIVRIETKDQIAEHARVTSVGVSRADLQTVDGGKFVAALYSEVVSIAPST